MSLTPCPPRYSTPRTKSRPTFGPAAGQVAQRLGLPFMPHQAQVMNTALEVGEDGHLAYRTVVLTVPRQGGKTTVTRVLTTWWGMTQANNLILSTAQSGLDARTKWHESH
jgi:hypothetical protein